MTIEDRERLAVLEDLVVGVGQLGAGLDVIALRVELGDRGQAAQRPRVIVARADLARRGAPRLLGRVACQPFAGASSGNRAAVHGRQVCHGHALAS